MGRRDHHVGFTHRNTGLSACLTLILGWERREKLLGLQKHLKKLTESELVRNVIWERPSLTLQI